MMAASLQQNAKTPVLFEASSSSAAGGGGNTLPRGAGAKRRPRPRGVGLYGALLLVMSGMVQRSMAANEFFKGGRGNTARPRPPSSSNHRSDNGNRHPASPGSGGGGRGAALSPAMYTRISRGPAGGGGGGGGADRAAAGTGGGMTGRHAAAGVASTNQQQQQPLQPRQQRPGFRSGQHTGGATPASNSNSCGGEEEHEEQARRRRPSADPRYNRIAESLLEKRTRGSNNNNSHGSSSNNNSGSSGSRAPRRTNGGEAPPAWHGAGGAGQGHSGVPVPTPGAVRREAFLAAGRTPSGRRAALEPRAGAEGGGSGGGGPPAFDQYGQRRQQGQGRGFSGQDPWNADSSHNSNAFDYGREPPQQQQQQQEAAAAAGAGVPGSNPPPRTPLQEQAFQNKYNHQNTQIPGQAVGTQAASSSLFRRAGSGGVMFFFVILVCRALNHYEYADQHMRGAFRVLSMVPAVTLFVGNMVCLCLSLVQSATSRQKARMKTMLTINAVSEAVLMLFNMLVTLGGKSGVVPKEEFISRMLTNVLFMSLCFTFAKARWVADGAF